MSETTRSKLVRPEKQSLIVSPTADLAFCKENAQSTGGVGGPWSRSPSREGLPGGAGSSRRRCCMRCMRPNMIKSIGSTINPMRRNVSESISPPDWFGSWCMGSSEHSPFAQYRYRWSCRASLSQKACLSPQHIQQRSCQFIFSAAGSLLRVSSPLRAPVHLHPALPSSRDRARHQVSRRAGCCATG